MSASTMTTAFRKIPDAVILLAMIAFYFLFGIYVLPRLGIQT